MGNGERVIMMKTIKNSYSSACSGSGCRPLRMRMQRLSSSLQIHEHSVPLCLVGTKGSGQALHLCNR